MRKQKEKLEPINHKSRLDLYKKSTYRRKNEKPQNAIQSTMRVVRYLYAEKLGLTLVISLIFITIVISLSEQYVNKIIIDQFIDSGITKGFLNAILFLSALYVFEILTSFLSSFYMIGISQRTLKTMRKNVFEKLQRLAVSFFDRNRDGDLMSRMTNDIDNISSTMTQTFVQFISSMMTLILTLVLMIIMNWKLTIIAMITIPLIYYAAKLVSSFSRTRFRRMRFEIGALNGFVAEQITGAKVIQSFCQEDEIVSEFTIESGKVKKITVSAMTWASLMNPIIGMLNNLRYIIIIGAGALFAIQGDPMASIGTITVFVTLANRFGGQINNLADMYTNIQNALSGAERVFEILDDQSIIFDREETIPFNDVRGHVELKDVTFSYIEDNIVLNHVTIDALPGQKIAFVGHTGAGKTTIINLITRFYDIQNGEILIDGINVKDMKQSELHQHVGIVLQDTNLFSDTIFNNIRYGKLDATMEDVIEAAKAANCHAFISELENGYQTVLTRNGSNISHGQRQLLSIARTLLKNPDILILDEATSSVDTITEKQIQKALERLMENKTSFIIAHRLSTIRNADKIVVIENGKIIEQGNHASLLDVKGIYYQLHYAKDLTELKNFDLVNG